MSLRALSQEVPFSHREFSIPNHITFRLLLTLKISMHKKAFAFRPIMINHNHDHNHIKT